MPTLTVTLSDVQWAAYQAVSEEVPLDYVSAWLKRQLVDDYQTKLKGIDRVTAQAARDIKVAAFEA